MDKISYTYKKNKFLERERERETCLILVAFYYFIQK